MLIATDKYQLTIVDKISGTEIAFYHKRPDYADRIRYHKDFWGSTVSENGERKEPDYQKRVEYGLKVMTGFEENKIGDENGKPISSDPKNENYRADWKEFIEQNFPEFAAMVAVQAYEGMYVKPGENKQLPFQQS